MAGAATSIEPSAWVWQAHKISKAHLGPLRRLHYHPLQVLTEATLEVAAGEIVALTGPSGSGKTSLAQIALRLESADSGELYLEGRPYAEYPDRREFYRRIQMVFQQPHHSLNPRWTVAEALAEPLRNLTECSENQRLQLLPELLAEVHLPADLLSETTGNLSGGQAQRVALARALAGSPRFVVLDEPTSSLDQVVQRRILKLIRELRDRRNVAFLLITHDLGAVRQVADRQVRLVDGRID